MTRKWGRLRTSQWHIVDSIRAGSDGTEFILTVDGEYLPTLKRKWDYLQGMAGTTSEVTTHPQIWEGDGKPRGRVCSRCSSYIYFLERSVQVDT